MSLATDVQNSEAFTEQAYRAVGDMGGDLPSQKNLANLPAAVDSIPTAPQGDGTLWGTLYTTAYPNGLVLNSKADYDALGNSRDITYSLTVNGVLIPKGSIRSFSFGSACTYTPNNFLDHTSVRALDHSEVLRQIGPYFLRTATSFDSALDLSNVTSIDYQFLISCTSFTHDLVIPEGVTYIGNDFMNFANSFTGLLTILTTATVPLSNSLYVSAASYPAYAQGVRITGPGAAAWKAALPDMTSGSFRKLILVEGV